MKQMILVVSCDAVIEEAPCPNPLDEDAAHTTTFTWGGITYERDLCPAHMEDWLEFMNDVTLHATPLGKVPKAPKAPSGSLNSSGHKRSGHAPAHPVPCPYCVYSYGLGAGLSRHIRQQHPEHRNDPLPLSATTTGGTP